MSTPKTINWDNYEYGRMSPRQGSEGSFGRIRFDEASTRGEQERLEIPRATGVDEQEDYGNDSSLRRRRSTLSMRLNSFTTAGGVNSIENFARSWQRAVGFHEINPSRSSFLVTDHPDIGKDRRVPGDAEQGPVYHRSLLRQQLEVERNTPPDSAIQDDAEDNDLTPQPTEQAPLLGSPSRTSDLFSQASYLQTPYSGSFGTYGSLSSRMSEAARQDASRYYREQQVSGIAAEDKDVEPLLVRRVEQEDGKVTLEVVGQSTIYQTVLNSTNVLIGIGLLSLPLGFRYAGWLAGLLFITFSAIATNYTAKLLGKCLDFDKNIITFADLAFVAFGPRAQIVIGFLFVLELTAACVALFILFADSLDLLIQGYGVTAFKVLFGVLTFPLSFVPLRYLGYSSTLGIISCLSIVLLVILDGLLKPDAPGSLLSPEKTYLFPKYWSTLPLSFGLLMSPWGGHSVFPNIYRDMRHPARYGESLRYTFGFTYILDVGIAIAGLLMFGEHTRDIITSNLLMTEGYPKFVSVLIQICITVIPLTKIPLNARPIFSTFEHLCGLGPRQVPDVPGLIGSSGLKRGFLKCGIRLATTIIVMGIAIACPSFDRVMALMGSAFCFSVCIILPLAFYLKLFGKEIGRWERIFNWFLIVSCSCMAIVGTVWAFLPRSITHAR